MDIHATFYLLSKDDHYLMRAGLLAAAAGYNDVEAFTAVDGKPAARFIRRPPAISVEEKLTVAIREIAKLYNGDIKKFFDEMKRMYGRTQGDR